MVGEGERSRDRAGDPGSRAAMPVIGIVLLVAMTVVLAGMLGAMAFGLAGDEPGEPQFTAVAVEDVETSTDETHEPVADDCKQPQLVIGLRHTGGAALDPSELEYVIEATGDEGTTVSGRYDGSVLRSSDTITAGDAFELVLAADPDDEDCGHDGDDNRPGAPGQQPASLPGEAGADPGAGHGAIPNGFLVDDADETLVEVRVRIVHTPSETIIVDRTVDDV